MICSNCQTENPESARFCDHCGAKLQVVCPHCKAENRPGAKFCGYCGQRLEVIEESPEAASQPPVLQRFIPPELAAKMKAARGQQAMQGERRVVTMLFCDVKGSTAAAERLDPEEWTDIMNGAFEYMIRPVYRYEGTVARLMGDAVLAFFGAPIAHEDDPQRAVLAGLGIVEGMGDYRAQVVREWEVDIDVRVGINTGLVVVGAVGSDLRMEYTAMGDAINLAARMEQTAQPGSVQVSEDTYKLVAPLFVFEALGGIEVKGKSRPVRVYRVLGRKASPGSVRGVEGLDSPLIGRGKEKALLEEAIANLEKGLGGIVCLLGEAGLGKSRLLRELEGESRGSRENIRWFETLSLSYETEQPYGLFRRLLRRVIGAAQDENPEDLRGKIARFVEESSLEGEELAQRVFESLFGLTSASGEPPLEGETFKGLLYTVMMSLWRERASRSPVVFVCDDLHWSDPASVALLQHLFQLIEGVPLLLLCALRPETDAPGWEVKRKAERDYHHRYTEIQLHPLNTTESGELVDNLLRISDLPPRLRARIQEKAEGNPFFVEEVVRTLIDHGVVLPNVEGNQWEATGEGEDINIPDNVQALLIARIDRLAEEPRRTLQLASVVGRSFYYRILRHMVDFTVDELDQHLSTLQRKQMIREAVRLPEVEYIFRHALTQEAAYQTILLKQRRVYHHQVAEALEELYPDRQEELAGTIGRHFFEARSYEKALRYATLVGDAAYRLHAHQEAVEHYAMAEHCARKVETSSERTAHLYTRYGRALEHLGKFDDALAMYDELAALSQEREDRTLKLAALVASGTVRAMQGPAIDYGEAEKLASEGLTLAQEIGDRTAESRINWNLMRLMMIRGHDGDVERALSYGKASLATARELGLHEQMALTLSSLAGVYRNLNQPAKADAALEESQKLFRAVGNMPMLADSYATSAYFLSGAGEFEGALEAAKETRKISKSIGNLWNQGSAAFSIALVYRERGDVGDAIRELEAALSLPGLDELTFVVAILNDRLMNTLLSMGDLARAAECWEVLIDSISNFPPAFQQRFFASLARLQLAQGDLPSAHRTIRKASDGLNKDTLQNALGVSHVLLVEASIELAMDKAAEGLRAAEETVALVEKFNVRINLPHALLLKGRALHAQGEFEEAAAALNWAKGVAEEMGARLVLWQILAALAAVEARRGVASEANSLRAQAQRIIGYIADHAGSDELRDSFLRRAEVREILGETTGV